VTVPLLVMVMSWGVLANEDPTSPTAGNARLVQLP
jgi:hypothetical protein